MPLLRLLGIPSIEEQGKLQTLALNTPSSLLFYLAAKADWVSRSELAFLYRPDETETEALKYLRLQLHRAQHYPWASNLEIEKTQVRWLIESDLRVFQRAIKEQHWQQAIELYKDSFFGKHSFKDLATYSAWIDLEREELEQSYRLALNKQLERYEQQAEFEQAATLSAKLLALDELDETALQNHLRHLALAGQKDAALKRFSSFSKLLKEDLGSEVSAETLELIKQIKQGERILRKTKESKHNLPSQTTRFIGRRAELAELSKRLSQPDCRLLSLIGLGGTGKTRLALELARGQLGHFRDGVYSIALAALASEDSLISSSAQVFGLTLEPSTSPRQQLLNYVRDKQLLLLFDNFEQLLESAGFISELLAVSAQSKIIVTSRERLKLKSEWLFDVQGLSYPELPLIRAAELDSGHELEPAKLSENLEAFEAISLFISAARRVLPQLEFSYSDLASIATIAHQVEGLPLALELAASWVRIMPVLRIAQELERGFDLLQTELSDIPERHRNLKQILDKTWEGLSDKKRQTLARLSVFTGGCTLEAAEQVTATHVSILLSLINESLVKRSTNRRLELHLLVKQYAHAKLEKSPELEESLEQHARFYAEQLASHAKASGSISSLELRDDSENCRLSWLWLAKHQRLEELEASLNGIDYLYSMTGRYLEGNQLYEESLKVLEKLPMSAQRDRLMAGIINGQADRLITLGQLEQAKKQLYTSLSLLQPLQDVEKQTAYVLTSFARLSWEQGNYPKAQAYLQEALDTVKALGDSRQECNILHGLAIILRDQGKFQEAQGYYQEVIRLYLSMNEVGNAALALNNLAALELATHQPEKARETVARGLELIKNSKAYRAEAFLYQTYAGTLFSSQNYSAALTAFEQALALAHKVQDQTIICDVLTMLGRCHLKQQQQDNAKRYFMQSLSLAQDLQSPPRVLANLVAFAELYILVTPVLSLKLLSTVLEHPACRSDLRSVAEALLSQLPQQTSKTSQVSLDAIVQQLLSGFNQH